VTGTAARGGGLVLDALSLGARGVEPLGRARWRIDLTNGKPFTALARLEDGWLVLEARPALPRPDEQAWEVLRLNGSMGDGGRLTLPSDGGAPRLRAEVPLWEDACGARVEEACRGLEAAFGRVGNGTPARARPGATGEDGDEGDEAGAADLRRLLSEAGWECAEGKGQEIAVPLDVPGAPYRAAVRSRARGGPWIGVEVAAAGTLGPVARRALGRLLLVGTGLVRLVRAAAATTEAGESARLEVILRVSPSAAELDFALEALSVACRSLGREAKVLAREEVAGAYLELCSRERGPGTGS